MRLKAINYRYFIVISSFLFLISCQEQPFYNKNISFKGKVWARSFKPCFNVVIKDTSKVYDFIITLRTTSNYAYSNAWIYLISKTPDKQMVKEPFEIRITDKLGVWLGKKTGSIVENQLIFRRRKLPKLGQYFFVLEQGITKKSLTQVEDIGLLIQEVK
jgi:gliding motility-associated lipoprotein GldH